MLSHLLSVETPGAGDVLESVRRQAAAATVIIVVAGAVQQLLLGEEQRLAGSIAVSPHVHMEQSYDSTQARRK